MTIDINEWFRVTSPVTGIEYDFATEEAAKAWEARIASTGKVEAVVTYPRTDFTKVRVFPGLYLIGPVAVSRECENWDCGCERYAIRPRTDDGIEMGDWITTRRHLKDALAAAEEYAKEVTA